MTSNWDEMLGLHLAALDNLIDREAKAAAKVRLLRTRAKLEAQQAMAQRMKDNEKYKSAGLLLRAEECRTLAEHCESDAARRTYEQMAWGFEQLATRASAPSRGTKA
jgi:hypothetical protein